MNRYFSLPWCCFHAILYNVVWVWLGGFLNPDSALNIGDMSGNYNPRLRRKQEKEERSYICMNGKIVNHTLKSTVNEYSIIC